MHILGCKEGEYTLYPPTPNTLPAYLRSLVEPELASHFSPLVRVPAGLQHLHQDGYHLEKVLLQLSIVLVTTIWQLFLPLLLVVWELM